ncbi:hypothetical protein HCN44_006918 [Aphidius gifuensis]|uniref:Venom acid phosphatase n=2 Tax=Aphidius gifuensis TaxID=684658 RepID=A0A834Y0S0_APHGI|nr:venom acid phosphatase Acph-1-like isoform X2 [Aphidius gifuensis]KAF7995811.1 hypothetical protein HCN44_006918 [Aphidius gifuensis]
MRHGERAPVDTYPKDPNINGTMEPNGWGQLTNKGKENISKQGANLRQRYNKFLGDTYSPDVYWLQTSSADRTKMTGSTLSSTLWPPSDKQRFNWQLNWQPVVSNYWTRQNDNLLIIWNACPKLTQERMKLETSDDLKIKNEENKKLYSELTKLTGKNISSPADVGDVYGTLKSEDAMGIELPEWTKNYYPDKLTGLSADSLEMNVGNDILKRLAGGPFIKKAVVKMQAKASGNLKPEKRKMFAYIAHDSTIVNVLVAMGVWDGQVPDFSAMIIIELHEVNGNWNVQVFERKSVDKPIKSLIIPGCERECPLNKFAELMKPVMPDNYSAECKVSDPHYDIPAAPPA